MYTISICMMQSKVGHLYARRTGSEEEAQHVACSEIKRRSTDREGDHCEFHHSHYVPSSIVELARGDENADTNGTGDERWRGNQD